MSELQEVVVRAEAFFRALYPKGEGRVALGIGSFLDFKEGEFFVTSVDAGGDKSILWRRELGRLVQVAQAIPRLGAQLSLQAAPSNEQTSQALSALERYLDAQEAVEAARDDDDDDQPSDLAGVYR